MRCYYFFQETQTPTYSYYSRKRIVAEGLLDLGLLMANATQLKTLISVGNVQKYYWPILGATSLSIVIQIIIAVMLLVLGTVEKGSNSSQRAIRLHHATVVLILIVTVINIFITAFWINVQPDNI